MTVLLLLFLYWRIRRRDHARRLAEAKQRLRVVFEARRNQRITAEEMETAINRERRQLGLPPIDF